MAAPRAELQRGSTEEASRGVSSQALHTGAVRVHTGISGGGCAVTGRWGGTQSEWVTWAPARPPLLQGADGEKEGGGGGGLFLFRPLEEGMSAGGGIKTIWGLSVQLSRPDLLLPPIRPGESLLLACGRCDQQFW